MADALEVFRPCLGLFQAIIALLNEALSLAHALLTTALLVPLLLLTCQPLRALKMLRYSFHLPRLRAREQMACEGVGASGASGASGGGVASGERAAARLADAAGMAKIASTAKGQAYTDAVVDALPSGGGFFKSAPLDYLPPAAEPEAESAASAAPVAGGAATLAVPGGGRAFLWREPPRAERVKQGGVGSCWLIATIAATAEHKGAIEQCFPAAGKEELPAGACPVALYDVDGARRTLPLDTRLYYNPAHGAKKGSAPPAGAREERELAYATSKDSGKQELWVPMLEKGMARLKGGGYKGIHGGQPAWALFALTGASIEVVMLAVNDGPDILAKLATSQAAGDLAVAGGQASPLKKLLAVLMAPVRCIFAHVLGLPVCGVNDLFGCLCPRAARRACSGFARAHCFRTMHVLGALKDALLAAANFAAVLALVPLNVLLCCSLDEIVPTFNGIFSAHAYSILADHRVALACCGVGCGSERVVQVRNPHGPGGTEWRGKWSDNSAYWLCVSDADKQRVGYKWSDESYCAKPCIGCCTSCPCFLVCFPCCYYNKKAFGRTENDDGAFFMSEADFLAVFDRIDICHARPGWASTVHAATLSGTCAYFSIRVDKNAPLLPPVRTSTVEGGGSAAAGHSVVQINPLAAGSPRGVFASVAIADPAGGSRLCGAGGVRITVFDDATRQPVASTQQEVSRDSFVSIDPVAGTSVAAFLAGRSYTAFVQWGGTAGCNDSGGSRTARPVSLIVTASDPGALAVSVPAAAPSPPLPWAPVGPTAYGECAKRECGLALPANFAFLLGERYHRECTPEVLVCGHRVL